MIRRRFVNLVAENSSTGVLSLHRLDVAKHLFYPSTAKAEAANAASNGGGKPPRIGSLRRLPPPTLRFERLSAAWDRQRRLPEDDQFVLLSPHSSEGKILQASGEDGHAILYDVGSGSATTMPSIEQPLGHETIFVTCCPAHLHRAGTGTEEEGSSLFVMARHYYWQQSFQVLDLSQHPLKWQPLPLPPLNIDDIRSFTVAGGGRTICASTRSEGTYCFDTRSHEWRHAGDWALPFNGRAEHVPELGSWLGFCSQHCHFGHGYHSYQLCASDLSAMDAHQAPTLQHVWEDLKTPEEEETIELKRKGFRGTVLRRTKEWSLRSCNLINLGGGRFCIAKVFRVRESIILRFDEGCDTTEDCLVLSGVEVIRGGDGGGGLRMVKHKSKCCMFSGDKIQWVL